MDPNTCLTEMLSALISGDYETAAERLEDLREWAARGGFTPDFESCLSAATAAAD